MVKPDVNFSQRSFTEFREEFCMKNVRQGMVVTLLEFVLDTASVSHNATTELLRYHIIVEIHHYVELHRSLI